MAGAVLNTLNTRLDAAIIAFMLDHGEAKVLIVDREYSKVVKEALRSLQGAAVRDRLRRPGIRRRGRAARRPRIRGIFAEGDAGFPLADAGRRMGRDCAQLHLRHDRRSRRASSTIIAAPICWRWRMSSPAAWASIRSICGRCRCSTATAGAFLGRCRSSPARMSACARCAPRRSIDAIAAQKVTHLCGAPIVMSTLLNAPASREASRCRTRSNSSPPPRRRRRRCWRR